MKWRYVIAQKAVETLLVCKDEEIAQMIVVLELLVMNPFTEPDWIGIDRDGVRVCCRQSGHLIIGYWLDRNAKEVRVQAIDRVPIE